MSEGVKQEHIVEAAIRRFSYYGVHKTTLTEIAEDLALSKQALAYYFHDKQSLVNEVGNKIASEYMDSLQTEVSSAASTEDGLFKLLEVKRDFFQKYFMLAIQAKSQELAGSHQLTEIQKKLKGEELLTISGLMKRGMISNELGPLNEQETALLILDTLHALSFCVKERIIFQDEQLITELFEKQKAVLGLFYHGLKSHPYKIQQAPLIHKH